MPPSYGPPGYREGVSLQPGRYDGVTQLQPGSHGQNDANERIKKWYLEAKQWTVMHERLSSYYRYWGRRMNLLLVALNALVTSGIFVSLVEGNFGFALQIAAGTLSLILTVASAVRTEMNYDGLAEEHKAAFRGSQRVQLQLQTLTEFRRVPYVEIHGTLHPDLQRTLDEWSSVQDSAPPPSISLKHKVQGKDAGQSWPGFFCGIAMFCRWFCIGAQDTGKVAPVEPSTSAPGAQMPDQPLDYGREARGSHMGEDIDSGVGRDGVPYEVVREVSREVPIEVVREVDFRGGDRDYERDFERVSEERKENRWREDARYRQGPAKDRRPDEPLNYGSRGKGVSADAELADDAGGDGSASAPTREPSDT